MKTLDARVTALEAAQVAALAGDPVADWLKAYRAGADVATRNAAAGQAWVLAAEERHRLADETLVSYETDD